MTEIDQSGIGQPMKADSQLHARYTGQDEAAGLDEEAGWDRPGRDGVIGDTDADPDRREVRAEIGIYVSLATFPATTDAFVEVAAANGAPDEIVQQLSGLGSRTFANASELWEALGLESSERF